MTTSQAAHELNRIKHMFVVLPESPDIYPVWEALVTKHEVSGKLAHDARLVASMRINGLKSILTFDQDGFTRFPIIVVHPVDVRRPLADPASEEFSE